MTQCYRTTIRIYKFCIIVNTKFAQCREALRGKGLKVWIDEREIADFESITRSIAEGLANAKALLAFYSGSYPQSRACQWELTAGFLAAQQEGECVPAQP